MITSIYRYSLKITISIIMIINGVSAFSNPSSELQKTMDLTSIKRNLTEASKEFSNLESLYDKLSSRSEKEEIAKKMTVAFNKIKECQVLLKYHEFDAEIASLDELAEMATQLFLTDHVEEALPLLFNAGKSNHIPSLNMLGVIFYTSGNLDQSLFWLTSAYTQMTPDNIYLPVYHNLAKIAKKIAQASNQKNDRDWLINIYNSCAKTYNNLLPLYCNETNSNSLAQFPKMIFIDGITKKFSVE